MEEAAGTCSVSADKVFEIEYESECPSLSGRSVLTFQAGSLRGVPNAEALHVRISANSGRGMFCKDWVPVASVDAILAVNKDVSSKSCQELWNGRSINNGGFLLAVLKELGLAQRESEESRAHSVIAGATLHQALQARIAAPKTKQKRARSASEGA